MICLKSGNKTLYICTYEHLKKFGNNPYLFHLIVWGALAAPHNTKGSA